MWAPLYLLAFLRFIDAANTDIDPLTQIARAFFKEDFFYTHLKSEFVNASISPCDNFYRRLCPKDFPAQSWIWKKILAQMKAIMNINDFMSPEPQDYTIQRINATSALDETNYTDVRSIATAINRLESLDVFKGCLVPDDKYFHLLPAALVRDRKSINNIEDTILVERTIRMRVQRDGVAHESARAKIESIISNIIEEYLLRIRNASWSSKEDRFGQTRGVIVAQYIRNVSYEISFANRYSAPENTKDDVASKYRNTFLREHQLLSDLSHMPRFRNTCAKFKVIMAMLEYMKGAHKTQLINNLSPPLTPVAYAIEEMPIGFILEKWLTNSRLVASIVMNQVFSIHAALSAQDASLIGFTGFPFAHELYHQVQLAFKGFMFSTGYIEDISDHQRAEQCVIDHYTRVCSRFNEKIVYPDLNMTSRELFYFTVGASWCTADMASQWFYKSTPGMEKGDIHNGFLYRTNGLLGQLPDFKRTFGCYEDDRMVFPEKSMCPAL